MILSKETAKHIINLNPYAGTENEIDPGVANRQFEVVLKGFNYLYQEGNDFLYVADEVGLGKTYIALGIAFLLRHFTTEERREFYKDVIIVPKRNLQYKWVKEAKNFNTHNYLIEDNIVKSVLGNTVGECSDKTVHHALENFSSDYPSYELFRNSSFSIATSNEKWEDDLQMKLPEGELRDCFKRARVIFLEEEQKIHLKRLYAYLTNITLPEIDLLIVDEAHHYKHGIGDDVSNRNQVVSRLMGVVQKEDEEDIFKYFPDIRQKISRKAKKVIFLSATPIDNGLHEIKNQLDCFIPSHRFKNSGSISEDIKNNLNSFMIRGLMSIELEDEVATNGSVTRNMYRHEHRRGNVTKIQDAAPQKITSDLESLMIGLVQFKTLKHLNESNNKSFEIGMLAGFETFNVNNSSDREFEETATRTTKESEDQNIIKEIAESYFKTFNRHLPHPKQDNLVNVLFEGVKNQKKSLVFVRRIATVIELERKLTLKIEEWQHDKIKKYVPKSNQLAFLEKAYNERHEIIEIEDCIEILSQKVADYFRGEFTDFFANKQTRVNHIKDVILTLYYSDEDHNDLESLRHQIKKHIGKQNIKSELRNLAFNLIKWHLEYDKSLKKDEEEFNEVVEEFQPYFFSNYFSSKRYIEGFNFRKRASVKNWYRFNLFHIAEFLPQISFDLSGYKSFDYSERDKTDNRRMDFLNEILSENIKYDSLAQEDGFDEKFLERTFLNDLLSTELKNEFQNWCNKKIHKPSKGYDFLDDLNALIEILQGIFRNGSGILPAFVAESLDKDNFNSTMIKVLKDSFPEVLSEVSTIIRDFDKIMTTNFSNRNRIQRALFSQHPIAGVSGFHRRDVGRMATQFRMPGYPYVLITTDILKEGEDLHLYCQDVYHYGIAWNPSDMEQRTGRIDRINSDTYFKLKAARKRTFDNSLQVFYPYLADTLEVNQVAKVFNKMNDFIETFYDITSKRDKESRVSTDEIIENIPSQIKDLLKSKFDFNSFTGVKESEHEELMLNETIGSTKLELWERLRFILSLIENNFKSFINKNAKYNEEQFQIMSNLDIDGRRGPLKIQLIPGSKINEIEISIESIICRSTELRENKKKDAIRAYLFDLNLEFSENYDYLVVRKTIDLESDSDLIKETIQKVIFQADGLEKQYLGSDLDVY